MTKRAPGGSAESEWVTRKRRIDPLLDAAGWPLQGPANRGAFRSEEEETANGPADYALWLDDRIVGIIEARGEALSRYGERFLERVSFRNCQPQVRNIVALVVDCSLGGFAYADTPPGVRTG